MRLTTQLATTSMIATIHTLKAKAKLNDDSYRDLLEKLTGTRSAKGISVAHASRVIEHLRGLAGDAASRGAVAGLDSAVGKKLRALWIAGYDLGIVRERTDNAMLSYLERITGVSHPRFLSDAKQGTRAIEGLKAWLAREGKVEWPADSKDVIANKRAVINAIWLRLVEVKAVEPYTEHQPLLSLDQYAYKIMGKNGWNFADRVECDKIQNALGRKMRFANVERAQSGRLQ